MLETIPDRMQATFDPDSARLALWGSADPGEAARACGLPEGDPGTLRVALPAGSGTQVVPAAVPARFLSLEPAMAALLSLSGSGETSATVESWRRAAQLVTDGAAPAAYEELAGWMPVAAHAVLRADEQAIPTPHSLLAAFRDAVTASRATAQVIRGDLRGYQQRGVAWLRTLGERGGGGILADEMGLGKTLQAICLLAVRDGNRPHLVVCPTSLVGTWERELERFAPTVPVVAFHGSARSLPVGPAAPGTVVVTSYAVLRRDIERLGEIAWDVVVFDEAQQVKNPSAQATRAARGLDARVRLAMTGTPVENRLDDLWSIMSVTSPGLLGPRARFRARFAAPIEQRRSARAAERLAGLLEPHLLRRTKTEVAADLPPKQHVLVMCTLTREQAELYRRCVDEAFDAGLGTGLTRRGRVLGLLTRLKQVCNHPAQLLGDTGPLTGRSGKLDRSAEMLAEIAASGDRALVFTQYRAMGELLSRHLAAVLEVPSVPFLHGGLPAGARDRLVTAFQEAADTSPVLVLSLRAAGYGLTLTRANHVLHYDRWWNPAVEDQASDRVHRVGQQRTVTVHTLLTGGTVEEHIARLHEGKRGLAGVVIGDAEAAWAELPDHDLRELLELSREGEG
ncbi:hypothetical protein GCM10012275_22460 [Longimycelium tulufanense]|uniref:Uncharacterized protein n=1 Tax=Longimycelium tulufanense TaxID=907463 RepID=A0A8J3FVE6_9PSEU|nr:DEAD/DEAH box helicase [Longimycelium tulufanense]GGM51071.1 hypothetical protein GCM10012275_22460 [Longimycelium tulufanense]